LYDNCLINHGAKIIPSPPDKFIRTGINFEKGYCSDDSDDKLNNLVYNYLESLMVNADDQRAPFMFLKWKVKGEAD
jgi:hypothetical protein